MKEQITESSAAVCFSRLLEKVLSIPLDQSAPPSLDKQQEAERQCRQILDGMTSKEKADCEHIATEILTRHEQQEAFL